MINESEIAETKLIKETQFTRISLGILLSNNQQVIIKRCKKSLETKPEKLRFTREVQILRTFASPYIEKIIGFQKDDTSLPFIVTQFYSNGSLQDIFDSKQLDATQRMIIASGIASGMRLLHSKSIIHRDLKPENVLLNDKMEPCVSGFSFSKSFEKKPMMSIIAGTPLWMAPELFEEKQYNVKVDVYAFSMILYQLVTGNAPFGGHIRTGELINKIFNNERPEIPQEIPKAMSDLIRKCWDQNPENRPTFNEIIDELSKQECVINGTDIGKLQEYQKRAFSDIDDLLAKGHAAFASGNKELATECYTKAAEKGSAEAYYYLGNIIPERSIEYYKLAAEKGYLAAAVVCGERLLRTDPVESVKLFTLAAEKGDAAGEFSLGICKIRGLGTEKNPEEGFKLLKSSASKGNAAAQYSVGFQLEHGDGVTENKEEALKYYLMASENGHVKATLAAAKLSPDQEALRLYASAAKLGNMEAMYYAGEILYRYGRSRDAARFLRPAAEAGHTISQYMCGKILYEGDGVKQDYQKAAVFLKYAADSGHTEAAFLCGKLLAEGKGVKKDPIKAAYYLKTAADNGNVEAMYILGSCLPDGEDYLKEASKQGHIPSMLAYGYKLDQDNKPEEAAQIYLKAAELHDSDALCNIGVMYENGRGIEKNIEKALQCYREAALLGSPLGQYNYAVLLESRGDKEQAIKFYKMSADRGDPDAQLSYANLIAPTNIEQAAEYSKLSADQGNSKAQCLYGQLLFVGRGVQKDKQQAKKYIQMSAEQGYERAVRLVKELQF